MPSALLVLLPSRASIWRRGLLLLSHLGLGRAGEAFTNALRLSEHNSNHPLAALRAIDSLADRASAGSRQLRRSKRPDKDACGGLPSTSEQQVTSKNEYYTNCEQKSERHKYLAILHVTILDVNWHNITAY